MDILHIGIGRKAEGIYIVLEEAVNVIALHHRAPLPVPVTMNDGKLVVFSSFSIQQVPLQGKYIPGPKLHYGIGTGNVCLGKLYGPDIGIQDLILHYVILGIGKQSGGDK